MMTGIMIQGRLKSDSSAVSATSGVSEPTDEISHAPVPTGMIDLPGLLPTDATVGSNSSGRLKAPPVCVDSELKSQSMTSSQLIEWVFPSLDADSTSPRLGSSGCHDGSLVGDSKIYDPPIVPYSTEEASALLHPIPASVSVVAPSSFGGSSSSLIRDCDVVTLSDTETKHGMRSVTEGEKLNARIILRKNSRQGRASQRWATTNDSAAGEPIRLVTGTVPILRGGKILFISASRKAEWILPKGGWEGDESIYESAVREAFEEAGVIGILGKSLSPVQYETRKSKKRRLEIEDLRNDKSFKSVLLPAQLSASISDGIFPSHSTEKVDCQLAVHSNDNSKLGGTESFSPVANDKSGVLSAETISRILSQSQAAGKQMDETMSVGSTVSNAYSHVKMTLFPLYVTKIMDEWPESGRFRRAVGIDDAIEMMEGRPEFKSVLMEVKALGLHLVEEPQEQELHEQVI